MLKWIERYPPLAPIVLTLAAYVVIRPWGEFPLNDDFVYARIARAFAASGRISIDMPCNSSVVGQVVLGGLLIKLFGFSHLLLRLCTMALGAGTLFLLDALLVEGAVKPHNRRVVLLTVGLNPLFLYLSASFMCELYGTVPMLLGVVLWFRERRLALAEGPVVRLLPALSATALIGLAFWTRQYCAIAFPALVAAAVSPLLLSRDLARLRSSAPALVLSSAVFAAAILGYFAWARWTGNDRPEFRSALGELGRVDVTAAVLGLTNFQTYATAFLLPVLALFSWRGLSSRAAVLGAAFTGAGVLGWRLLQTVATSDLEMSNTQHRVFPFIGNVLYNAGLGPVTLTDVYTLGMSRPHWSPGPWIALEVVLIGAAALWAPVAMRAWRKLGDRTASAELLWFALFFGVVSVLVPVQAFKLVVFDRYYLQGFLALALALGLLLEGESGNWSQSWLRFSVLLAPLFGFSVLGLHDQFRWQAARWELVAEAQKAGAAPTNIDAGYEVAGWLMYDDYLAHRMPSACLGDCGCNRGWWCLDASWHVGMNLLAGYETVRTVAPGYLMVDGPDLLLERRLPQRGLVRVLTPEGHRISLGAPDGVAVEAEWRLLTAPAAGAHPVYGCGPALSRDATCEGRGTGRLLGYLYDSGTPGTNELSRCRAGDDDWFISGRPDCEGQTVEEMLGYAPP